METVTVTKIGAKELEALVKKYFPQSDYNVEYDLDMSDTIVNTFSGITDTSFQELYFTTFDKDNRDDLLNLFLALGSADYDYGITEAMIHYLAYIGEIPEGDVMLDLEN